MVRKSYTTSRTILFLAEVLDLLTPEILDFKDKVFLEWSNELQTEMAEQAGNHITKVILFYQKIDVSITVS